MTKYSQFINFNIYLWESKKETVEEPVEEDDESAEKTEDDTKEKSEDDDDAEVCSLTAIDVLFIHMAGMLTLSLFIHKRLSVSLVESVKTPDNLWY